jgi:DEAD/DEAH box helicase domain-containing protein
LLHALEAVATLLLMCDRRDIATAIGERPGEPGPNGAPPARSLAAEGSPALEDGEFFEPNLYLYDAYPGGIGFSEPLFRLSAELLQRTRELVRACPCENGCPSCVGPAEKGVETKQVALAILDRLCK